MRLAGRELRGGLSGFRIFLLCLILGITTIAAVGSLSASWWLAWRAQGQTILGADVDFRLVHRQPLTTKKRGLRRKEAIGSRHHAGHGAWCGGRRDLLVEAKAVDQHTRFMGA
jgi:putative ABC transport system permease protein